MSIPRKSPPRKRNTRRANQNWTRAFHSHEFVTWIQSLPSVASGKGPCEAAHVGKKGAGGSRKADWDQIVPLTKHEHIVELHRTMGPVTFQAHYGIDFAEAIVAVQAAWRAHQGETC